LYVGKKVLGVVEFFSLEPRVLAPATQDFLFALGGQMGVFLERLSAGKSLEAANAQFLLVAEAASVAVFTIDEQSTILFANPFVEQLFGYSPEELIGKKLTLVMPEYLRHVHERGLAHYVATGERHVSWDGIPLPGLHKNGEEIPLMISFGEFLRGGKRVFTGFAKLRATESG
jgi:PAS domain S-box-containing protein